MVSLGQWLRTSSQPLINAGIWDCQSSQAVVEFVRRGIAAKQDLYRICENMMDNCLASNSETGGVGCDNMTMVVIGLLNGRTKEEWYNQIAERVANGDGPCAPPEYGKSLEEPTDHSILTESLGAAAEFRGPGIRNQFEENPEDYEIDHDRTRPFSVRSGRIILLGDGSTLIPDKQNDEKLFDHTEEEDQELPNQVQRQDSDTERNEREGTPGPQSATSQADTSASNGSEASTSPETPQKPSSS